MGTATISIRIINYDGDACSNVKVALSGQGSYFQQEYTDSDGWAYFTYDYVLDYNMDVSVEANGDFVGNASFADGGSESFTIDWQE